MFLLQCLQFSFRQRDGGQWMMGQLRRADLPQLRVFCKQGQHLLRFLRGG